MSGTEVLAVIGGIFVTYEVIKFGLWLLQKLTGSSHEKQSVSGKPIIKHCRNCKYSKPCFEVDAIRCDIKYKSIFDDSGRLTAIFCRYFKRAAGSSPEEK